MEQAALVSLRLEGFRPLENPLAPSAVYALVGKGEVLYIGQAKNVYQRLTAHLNARRKESKGWQKRGVIMSPGDARANPIPYDSVLIRWTSVADLDIVERDLILRFRPRYNLQLRTPIPRIDVNLSALGIKVGDVRRKVV